MSVWILVFVDSVLCVLGGLGSPCWIVRMPSGWMESINLCAKNFYVRFICPPIVMDGLQWDLNNNHLLFWSFARKGNNLATLTQTDTRTQHHYQLVTFGNIAAYKSQKSWKSLQIHRWIKINFSSQQPTSPPPTATDVNDATPPTPPIQTGFKYPPHVCRMSWDGIEIDSVLCEINFQHP